MSRARILKFVVKVALGIVVLAAVGIQIRRAVGELQAKGTGLRCDPPWVAASFAAYLAGLAVFGANYWLILRRSPAPISFRAAERAYLVGHLGKYIPGKAFVVLLRASLSAQFGGRASSAIVAVFYETLTMLLAGAVVAAGGFALAQGVVESPWWWVGISLALALGFWMSVEPRIFPRVATRLAKRWPETHGSFPEIDHGLMARCTAWAVVGWIFFGLSEAALVYGMAPGQWRWEWFPLIVAAVSFATVVGFVIVVLPGGLGVREGALMAVLTPALTLEVAVFSTLLLRLVWVFAEVIGSAIVYAAIRPPKPASPPASSAPHPGSIVIEHPTP